MVLMGTLLAVTACSRHSASREPASLTNDQTKECGAYLHVTRAHAPAPDAFADGIGAQARFSDPVGIAVDESGVLYVADRNNYLVRKITPDGKVTTLAGTAGTQGCADGPVGQAGFFGLTGIAVDAGGTVYALDGGSNRIRKIAPDGEVSTLPTRVVEPLAAELFGPSPSLESRTPQGIAVDDIGNMYVTVMDAVLKVTPSGDETVFAGNPVRRANQNRESTAERDGYDTSASFHGSKGIALDAAGVLYVTDDESRTIRTISPRRLVATLAGAAPEPSVSAPPLRSVDGSGEAARFYDPEGIAVGSNGTLYVADGVGRSVRKITRSGIVSTLAGSPGQYGSQDGQGPTARLMRPAGIAVDRQGNIFVADSRDNTIRKITPSGEVTTFAGKSWYLEHGKDPPKRSLAPVGQKQPSPLQTALGYLLLVLLFAAAPLVPLGNFISRRFGIGYAWRIPVAILGWLGTFATLLVVLAPSGVLFLFSTIWPDTYPDQLYQLKFWLTATGLTIAVYFILLIAYCVCAHLLLLQYARGKKLAVGACLYCLVSIVYCAGNVVLGAPGIQAVFDFSLICLPQALLMLSLCTFARNAQVSPLL